MTRGEFVSWLRDFLADSAGLVNCREIARVGRASAALTPAEAARIEGAAAFPTWLTDEFAPAAPPHVSSSYQSKTIKVGRQHELAAPICLGEAAPPASLSQAAGVSPTIEAFSGEKATFVLENFMKSALLPDGYIAGLTDAQNLWTSPFYRSRTPHRLRGRTFVCVVEGSALFSHWLLDTLPRMHIAQLYDVDLSQVDNVVIATKQSGFHREGLAAVGIDEGKIVTRAGIGPLIECDEFVVVSDVRRGFIADAWLYDYIKGRFLPPQPAAAPNRRLFISRSAASRRRIVNESQLYPILEAWQFEIVHAEKLTIAETAQLVRQASHVVGPHGAGLCNICFATEHTRLLEIYGAHLSSEFWKICNGIGAPYYCAQATDPEGNPFEEHRLAEMTFADRNGADMYVSPAVFAAIMEQFMS